jgi:hypothetical protein
MKIKLNDSDESNDRRPIRFDPAEGNYRVIFSHFKSLSAKNTKRPKIRVFWDILFPSNQDYRHRIWKDYLIKDGEVINLRSDLSRIFGERLIEFYDDSGNLDTDKLLGKEADAEVGKKITDEYDNPLTVVKNLYPVGKFKFQ